MARLSLQFCFCLLLSTCYSALGYSPWNEADFPNPLIDVDKCGRHGVPSWICDPDSILSSTEGDTLEGIIIKIKNGEEPFGVSPCGSAGLIGSQVGLAIMRNFKLLPGESSSATAEHFAKYLHDLWGVGNKECNNGVLVLLSIDNRQLYISTGAGIMHNLTDAILQQIISRARPVLSELRYYQAIEQMIVDIGLSIAGHPPDHDESKEEDTVGIVLFSVFGSIIAVGLCWTGYATSKQRKRYKACKDKLEQLKAAQQNQGRSKYNPTSCPICLEDFDQSASKEAHNSSSDGEEGDATNPLLGPKTNPSSVQTAADIAKGALFSKGAKQHSPLVLPCGHAFCTGCITEWMKMNKVTCPVCRKPVDGKDPAEEPSPAPRGPCIEGAEYGDNTERMRQDERRRRQRVDPMGLDLMATELTFRLVSLQRLYPEYVSRDMVATWQNDINEGRSLSLDVWQCFARADPSIRAEVSHQGSSGASTSFGGGNSSGGGGAGGSW